MMTMMMIHHNRKNLLSLYKLSCDMCTKIDKYKQHNSIL